MADRDGDEGLFKCGRGFLYSDDCLGLSGASFLQCLAGFVDCLLIVNRDLRVDAMEDRSIFMYLVPHDGEELCLIVLCQTGFQMAVVESELELEVVRCECRVTCCYICLESIY